MASLNEFARKGQEYSIIFIKNAARMPRPPRVMLACPDEGKIRSFTNKVSMLPFGEPRLAVFRPLGGLA